MLPKMVRKHCVISADGEKLLENAITRLGLSARADDRILKVARTIADLEGATRIEPKHVSEAIQYGTPDRSYWAEDGSRRYAATVDSPQRHLRRAKRPFNPESWHLRAIDLCYSAVLRINAIFGALSPQKIA